MLLDEDLEAVAGRAGEFLDFVFSPDGLACFGLDGLGANDLGRALAAGLVHNADFEFDVLLEATGRNNGDRCCARLGSWGLRRGTEATLTVVRYRFPSGEATVNGHLPVRASWCVGNVHAGITHISDATVSIIAYALAHSPALEPARKEAGTLGDVASDEERALP